MCLANQNNLMHSSVKTGLNSHGFYRLFLYYYGLKAGLSHPFICIDVTTNSLEQMQMRFVNGFSSNASSFVIYYMLGVRVTL